MQQVVTFSRSIRVSGDLALTPPVRSWRGQGRGTRTSPLKAPATSSVAPVTYEESADNSQSTAVATSDGAPILVIGIWASARLR